MDSILLAGLDIGTTGCKVTVYNTRGVYIGRSYKEYPLTRTASEHEIDPLQIWKAVCDVLTQAATTYPGIAGIGVTSFGESFVLSDEHGEPLQNAMLYTDPRGEDECAVLCDVFGVNKLSQITGVKPHPMYSISKLMWVKNHQPHILIKAKYCFLMADYIVFKLTGKRQIDYSLASRTMAFDIHSFNWSKEIFNFVDISPELFSSPVPIGTAAGTVTSKLAKIFGLDNNTLILSCGHDQVAAAVGSGVFEGGDAVDGAGTVECITPVFNKIPENNVLTEGSYAIVPYVEKGNTIIKLYSR